MEEITSLTDEQIESYQKVYKECFNKEINKQEALEQSLRLVNFMKLLIEIDNHSRKLPVKKL